MQKPHWQDCLASLAYTSQEKAVEINALRAKLDDLVRAEGATAAVAEIALVQLLAFTTALSPERGAEVAALQVLLRALSETVVFAQPAAPLSIN
jgi:hypothetical protein